MKGNSEIASRKMKTIQFKIPEELYWELKKYWALFKANSWSEFLEGVVKMLEEYEKIKEKTQPQTTEPGDGNEAYKGN